MGRWWLSVNAYTAVVLLLLSLGLAVWLGFQFDHAWDWQDRQRLELSDASAALIEELDGPVRMAVVARPDSSLRAPAEALMQQYDALLEDFRWAWINPDTEPDQLRKYGIEREGQVVLEYGGNAALAQLPTEKHLSEALELLYRRAGQIVAYVTGHGERGLRGEQGHDLGQFGAQLERRGYRVLPLDLTQAGTVPDNTRVLVLATPVTSLLPAEHNAVLAYLARGGHLLLLTDPAETLQVAFLLDALGLTVPNGVVVDPKGADAVGLDDPRMVLVSAYPKHPAVTGVNAPALLPQAVALQPAERADQWRMQSLLQTGDEAWMDADFQPGEEAALDATAGDIAGPVVMGLALERDMNGKPQRVVAVGDGDFLSNRYLDNVPGNQLLGLNLLAWLVEDRQSFGVYQQALPDARVGMDRNAITAFAVMLLIGMPLICVLLALVFHRRRTRG